MDPIQIRTLRSSDAQALLEFEIDNREWFESHIDPRPSEFYSLQGVAEHIDAYLTGYALGTWHSLVVLDARGKIIGRANLKNIDSQLHSAEVGYRVARSACGQGLATQALRRLIEEARERWRLARLVAYVYPENAGSRVVLERCGFVLEQAGSAGGGAVEGRYGLVV